MGVLLVDDNPEVQDLVELTLQKYGLSVISVNDGLSALDLAISEKPDLILADFLVKGVDIVTFVKKIQRRAALANTPIVLLLQEESDADPIALQLAGMHTVLKKPLDPILLSKEVKKKIGIVEENLPEEEESFSIPIPEDFLSGETAAFEEKAHTEPVFFDTLDPLEATPDLSSMEPSWPNPLENSSIVLDNEEKAVFRTDVDSEKVDEAIRKIVLEVVERVAWEIIPGLIEISMPKGKIQSLVEQVVWEIVPPLAEIEIKKEIKRLQPDEGFSA